MINSTISFLYQNFPLFALAFACVLALIRRGGLMDYFMLLPVGLGGFWAFFNHTFLQRFAASQAGWETCYFQYSLGAAFLGVGIAGIVGFVMGKNFRLAVILIVSTLLWGDAAAHFYQLYYIGDIGGNASLFIYSNFLIPVSLWIAYNLDL
jgi:hypothetical protein